MIIESQAKPEAVKLDDDALEGAAGGLIIPAGLSDNPGNIPAAVIDDRTLEVLGQANSTQDAVKLAQSLGVSTERTTWIEYENRKIRAGHTE